MNLQSLLLKEEEKRTLCSSGINMYTPQASELTSASDQAEMLTNVPLVSRWSPSPRLLNFNPLAVTDEHSGLARLRS